MAEYPLAHGWILEDQPGLPPDLVADYLRAPIEEVPSSIARRIAGCRIRILDRLAPEAASRWTVLEDGSAEIELAAGGVEPHELAMELLICLGQIVWDGASPRELAPYLRLIEAELEERVTGEIDEDVLELKRRLLRLPGSRERLERYVAASFAATLAEYVHCLWHDVSVRTGPEHLEVEPLRARLELFERLFPPDPGQQLFG